MGVDALIDRLLGVGFEGVFERRFVFFEDIEGFGPLVDLVNDFVLKVSGSLDDAAFGRFIVDFIGEV